VHNEASDGNAGDRERKAEQKGKRDKRREKKAGLKMAKTRAVKEVEIEKMPTKDHSQIKVKELVEALKQVKLKEDGIDKVETIIKITKRDKKNVVKEIAGVLAIRISSL